MAGSQKVSRIHVTVQTKAKSLLQYAHWDIAVAQRIMEEKIEFMGLAFDNLTIDELMLKFDFAIQNKSLLKVFTPNVALLIWSRHDAFLKKAFSTCEVLTIDGQAIYYAMKMLRLPVKATLSPSIFYHPMLNHFEKNSYRLYLVGAKATTVEKNADYLKANHPGIELLGWHHGYFDVDDPPKPLLEDIRDRKPDIVLVGMTTPLKEKFIFRYAETMGASICIGVGGMFDIIAGEAKYAPAIVRKHALEWLFRLVQEPRRLWWRYLSTNTEFLWLMLIELFKRYTPKSLTKIK